MATRESALLELTSANYTVDAQDESATVTRALPLLSISRVFYHHRAKHYVNKNNYRFLRDALLSHDMDLVKDCILCGCPLQPDSTTTVSRPVSSSTKPGSFQVQDSDSGRNEPDLLVLVATYGRNDILQLVLERLRKQETDPEELYDLRCSLHQACKLNNGAMVEKLLEAEASAFEMGEFGFSAMHHAAYSGSLEVMKILLQHRCSIYVRTEDDRTPIHLAARKGFTSVVEFLLCQDPGEQIVSVLDANKNTPLHFACISGVDNVVLLLLRRDFPVNAVNSALKSALYIAAEKGRSSIIPILISFGASIDVRCGTFQRTPLMAASMNGHVTAVSELITSGASFQCTDSLRNSALELALDSNRDEVAALLMLREAPYSDYVQGFVLSQEFSLCKVLKKRLIKSAGALLDRMVIPEEGNTSQAKVKFRYLNTNVDNKLPGDKRYEYSQPYFLKLISELRLEELAYHGTVRLFVTDRMNRFGRFFLIYKTVMFFVFLLSMFYSFVVAARQQDPNDYDGFRSFKSVLRLLAEIYVVFFWLSNLLTEGFEVAEIFKRTWTYLRFKRKEKQNVQNKHKQSPRKLTAIPEDTMEREDMDPQLLAEAEKPAEIPGVWEKVAHWNANNLIVRFLIDYFSDSFNWFDQGGLAALFVVFILRAVSSPLQWLVMPIAFVLNCMRFFKLFNVYYSFGTYIRILVSVSFNELPPFLLFFLWTLFVFSGAFYVSLRLPTVWQVNSTLCASNLTSPDAYCQVGGRDPGMYTDGFDSEIWWVFLMGLRVLLEAAPVYEVNYPLSLNWFSTLIFLVFLFITVVIYLNLLIAQLTDRYSHVKKNALKVVAWYRLNFIIQSQDTSLIARIYNFREKIRTDSVTINSKQLRKYYGVDSMDEFVERGSAGFRDYLPEVTNEQLYQHQRFTSRTHEVNDRDLSAHVEGLELQLRESNSKMERLSEEVRDRYSSLETKLEDIKSLLSVLAQTQTHADK